MSVWTAMGQKRRDVFQAIMEGEDQGHDLNMLNWLMRWGLITRHERKDGGYKYRVPERTVRAWHRYRDQNKRQETKGKKRGTMTNGTPPALDSD